MMDYIQSFTWSNAPAGSFTVPCIAVATYLVVIYSIQYHVKAHRGGVGYNVQKLFAYHNLFMSLFSAIIFVGTIIELLRRVKEESGTTQFLFCESHTSPYTARGAAGGYYFWSYIYYLSKYYELLDTVFLALKGKLDGWGGLNVYHHSLVVFMAWNWLEYCQSLQHIGILFNTLVHIIMYYYFYLAGIGAKPRWKKYVTMLQIVQFCTSFACFLPNVWLHFNDPAVAAAGGCKGEYALLLNSLFNATLLLEFVTIFKRKPDVQGKPAVELKSLNAKDESDQRTSTRRKDVAATAIRK